MITPKPGRSRNVVAFLASLLVYAIPLPGPHAVPVLGSWLVGALTGGSKDKALGSALVTLAVITQALTFLFVRWIFGRPRRLLLLVAYVPAVVVGVFMMTMLVIPRWALIESDATPEKLSWPLQCSVRDAAVHAVRGPVSGNVAGGGKAWLRMGQDGSRFGLLHSDNCPVTPISAPPPRGTMHALVYAVPGGATLETTWDVPTQRTFWWWRRSPDSEAIELPPMAPSVDGVPILSDDGEWVVVVERPEPPPAFPRLVLRHLEDGAARTVNLEGLGPGTFVATGATLARNASGKTASGEIHLCRNEDEFLAIDLDGHVSSAPFRPPGVDAGARSFRRVESGWAAWDSYVEDRPYRIAWETRTGRGTHVVPKGRGITSIDIDPDGRWIAYSTSPLYSLGGVHDDVIVLSLADGAEVFRDSLPAYARSDVAFIGPGLLAYTALDGATQSEVRVVRAP